MAEKVDKELPRQAYVDIRYQRPKKGGKAAPFIFNRHANSMSFIENADAQSDTLEVGVAFKGVLWTDGSRRGVAEWFPERGGRLKATIVSENWKKAGKRKRFSCGKFCLDDVTISGPEASCVLKATSVPELGAIRSVKRTKTWKGVSVSEIAETIAGRYKLKVTLDFSADETYTVTEKQDHEDDLDFLTRICQDMGLGIQVNSGRLKIYSKKRYEEKKPTLTIPRLDVTDWSYNETLVGTYTCVEIRCAETEEHTALKCKVGTGKRKLVLNETFENRQDGAVKACARLNAENEKAVTMNITIPADQRIRAGMTVKVRGFLKLSGKYFVDKVTHDLDSGTGYLMRIEMHKCRGRLGPGDHVEFSGGPKVGGVSGSTDVGDIIVEETGDFVHDIAAYLQKWAPQYGFKTISPIIAQMINESGWGKSTLASQYYNYGGLKCGTNWTGGRVSMPTQEWAGGGYVTIMDDFRAYDSMEEGVKGYLEFLQQARYQNLKGISDPRQFLETIKADGYATDPSYVDKTYALITQNDLTQYDPGGVKGQLNSTGGGHAAAIVQKAASYLGQGGAIFQRETGLGGDQPWCASFVCSIFRWCGLAGIYYQGDNPNWCANILEWGRQHGYEVPKESARKGDVILFTWSGGAGIDHIGIIESNNGGSYTTIEGNYSNQVARVNRPINGTVVAIIRPPYTS